MRLLSKHIVATCLALLLLSGKTLAGNLVAEQALGVKQGVEIRQWTYLSDGLRVRGELYLPPDAGKRPLVVFCHDGISGISKEHRLSSIRLARAGYVVFSPSYRGEDGSEGMIEIAKGEVNDVLAVLPLLTALEQVDDQRVALVGTSHGALICTLAAARTDQVKALVLAYGVMDIYRWWYYLRDAGRLGSDPITDRTYGRGPDARPESFAIRNGLSVADRISCPVLILQGRKDEIVPAEQAYLMSRKLTELGKPVQVEVYPDCLHGFLVYAPYIHDADAAEKSQTQKAWTTMLRFFDKTLDARSEPAAQDPPPTSTTE